MTEFRFEHDFRAPSVDALLAAYFDPALIAASDQHAGLTRQVLEEDEVDGVLRRVCKIVPRRQLPAVLRPFVKGDLSFLERTTWRRGQPWLEQRIEPSLLEGRIDVVGRYAGEARPGGVVRRTFAGHVSVQIRLVGPRVERAIIEDMERSMAGTTTLTQSWLDRAA